MADYRVYIVGSDGHFETFEVIRADDDEGALALARDFADGRDAELWLLDRKVALLPAKQSSNTD